jgi:hypothetical protein
MIYLNGCPTSLTKENNITKIIREPYTVPKVSTKQDTSGNHLFSSTHTLGTADISEVCSESNAQGEITSIRIILKTQLFQDF